MIDIVGFSQYWLVSTCRLEKKLELSKQLQSQLYLENNYRGPDTNEYCLHLDTIQSRLKRHIYVQGHQSLPLQRIDRAWGVTQWIRSIVTNCLLRLGITIEMLNVSLQFWLGKNIHETYYTQWHQNRSRNAHKRDKMNALADVYGVLKQT